MTAATAAFSFAGTTDVAVVKPVGQRMRAPCLGLALVAGAALWAGIGSTVLLLLVA